MGYVLQECTQAIICNLSSSLAQENREDIERTQKTFCKLILQEKYKDYENALLKLNLVTLENKRQELFVLPP